MLLKVNLFFFLSLVLADEVSAITAEVSGVFGGRKSSGSSAGVERRVDSAQIQHRSNPRAQRVPNAYIRINIHTVIDNHKQLLCPERFIYYC